MLKLKPEYLKKNGKNEFVVLTVEDFDRIKEALEDAEDLRILRDAKRRGANSPTTSLAQMKRQLGIAPGRKNAGK
jgi:PHD/YefM family antitoxin component YafN of YafNO toxin-antitoxin module